MLTADRIAPLASDDSLDEFYYVTFGGAFTALWFFGYNSAVVILAEGLLNS